MKGKKKQGSAGSDEIDIEIQMVQILNQLFFPLNLKVISSKNRILNMTSYYLSNILNFLFLSLLIKTQELFNLKPNRDENKSTENKLIFTIILR